MNEKIVSLINWWKIKGENDSDPFVKLFFFYICFDAWITADSGEDSDAKKLRWFFNNKNCLKDTWIDVQDSRMESLLKNLKNLTPVKDMRPKHEGEEKNINEINNLEEIIEVIYQIRCNLFHGSKNPNSHRDAQLVDLAGLILEKWIIWTIQNAYSR